VLTAWTKRRTTMLTSLDKWMDAEPGLGAVRVSTPWIAGDLEFD
jgi:hypothetical protein